MSKCAVCRTEYKKLRMTQKVCGAIDCAIEQGRRDQIKRQRAADRQMRNRIRECREAQKTRAQWLREAQAAFNAWIRARDANQPCISCGRHHQGQYHAGHYRSVGAMPALRFCEDNVHKQCAPCNNHKSGNVVEYRIGLVKRIGLARVEWLEGPHDLVKYSIEDAKRIRDEYRQKLKEAA